MNIFNTYWTNEVDFNKKFNEYLNESLKKINPSIYIKKDKLNWAKGNKPDGIIFINGIPCAITEYKLYSTFHKHTLPMAACQECCYTYDEYKESIVPIKLHIIITENEILFISFDKYEYIYENFIEYRKQYPDISPCNFYKNVPKVRDLFDNIEELADLVIPMYKVDVDEVATIIYNKVA